MSVFSLTESQYQDIINIIDSHNCKTNNVGGLWSYIFTPTELGIFVTIRCNKCGVEWHVDDEDEDEF